jgi:hypothetical protein
MVASFSEDLPTPLPPTPPPPGETPEPGPTAEAPTDVSPTEDADLAPLPVGALVASVPLLYGPEQTAAPLELALPPGAAFTLLGKDQSGNWYRIREDHTGRQLVGWVEAIKTNLPSGQTGQVGSPPVCAAPRAYQIADGLTPSAVWSSDVEGNVVVVLDIFRDAAGLPTMPSILVIEVNGEPAASYPVKASRQAFLFRGLAASFQVQVGDQVRIYIQAPVSDEILYLRGAVFYVPSGCSF